MKKILVVTYGGGHARMLSPVVDHLLLLSNVQVCVLALTTAVLEFNPGRVEVLGYKDFFFQNLDVKKYGEALIKSLDKVVDHDEAVAYLGANYLELIEAIGEEEAKKQFGSLGRQAFNPIKSMTHILRKISPDLVVSTNSPRSEKAAIQAAYDLNIPAIALVDMFAIRCEKWFAKAVFADKVLVLSESVKRYLVSKGRCEKSIIVVGNPAFDGLVKRYNKIRDKIEAKRSSLPFTVLWASQREPEYCFETGLHGDIDLPLKVEERLVDIFSRHKDWRLIARNHPSEVQRDYPDFVMTSSQSDDLFELLTSVHLVITLTSTVGFQGAILGAKLVTIDLSVLTPTMPFSEMKLSKGVRDLDEIEPALLSIYENLSSSTTPVYDIDNSTERVLKEICSSLDIDDETMD